MRRYALILFSILTLMVPFGPILTAPSSHAYVLHGYHLLDLMRREMGTARSLEVVQKLTIQESDLPTEAVAAWTNAYPRVAEVPFESHRARMSTLHRDGDR